MGKLHSLRRAILREPEYWRERAPDGQWRHFGAYEAVGNRYDDNAKRPRVSRVWYRGICQHYRAFIKSVMEGH